MKLSKDKINLIKKHYDLNGYIVVRGLFDKETILSAEKYLWTYIEDNIKNFDKKEINFTKNGDINSIHNFSKWPWVKKLRDNKNLKKIVNKLIGNQAKNFGAELFAKPAKSGMPAPMHQDNYYWCIDNACALTVWISFGASNKKNGGIYYLKKTHKFGILEHKRSYAPGSSQTLKYQENLKSFKKIYPNLQAGDCVIHHCLSVHGSEKNNSNIPRVGCTLRYIGKNSKIDSIMKMKYEKDLKKHYKKIMR